MTDSFLLVSGYSNGVPVSFSVAFPVIGCLDPSTSPVSNEAVIQTVVRDTLTLSMLSVRVISNSINASSTFYPRINGVQGNQLVSFGPLQTGLIQDTSITDSLSSGDLIDSELSASGSGNSISPSIIAYELQNSSSIVPILAAAFGSGGVGLSYGTTYYFSFMGSLSSTTTESNVQYKLEVAGTMSNMRIYITGNSSSRAGTAEFRKNGANGNQALTITGNTTGAFEDTTHTDSISIGNTFDLELDTGSTHGSSTAISLSQVKFTGDNILAASYAVVESYNSGLTRYMILNDQLSINATESYAQCPALFSLTTKNFLVSCTAYSLNSAATVGLRKNGASSALSVSVSGTGFTEDTTHTVSASSSDLLNYIISTTGASSGSISLTYVGFEQAQGAAPPAVTYNLKMGRHRTFSRRSYLYKTLNMKGG